MESGCMMGFGAGSGALMLLYSLLFAALLAALLVLIILWIIRISRQMQAECPDGRAKRSARRYAGKR